MKYGRDMSDKVSCQFQDTEELTRKSMAQSFSLYKIGSKYEFCLNDLVKKKVNNNELQNRPTNARECTNVMTKIYSNFGGKSVAVN